MEENNQGRTAVHEIWHYLGLRHIWGDSNCGNDFCNDTPEHSGSNYGCPSYPSYSNCNGNGANGDMFMNYMDYTNDACMYMFTQCQADIMLSTLTTQRATLLENSFCEYNNIDEFLNQKNLGKIIDLLGRNTNHNGFNIHLYDDGSVQKQCVLK